MGQPKKKTTRRRTGNRRSHLMGQLAREVNRHSPVRVNRRTRRQLRQLEAAAKTRPPAAKSSPKPAPAAKTAKTGAKPAAS